ncbi:MAG: PilZ domain-containing protein [Bdellovibrionaceae bacterium]|nr:PilZ domain-containing protein [Bdellovibrio sp.]
MNQPSFFNQLSESNAKEAFEFIVRNQSNLIMKVNDTYHKTKMLSKKSDREFSVYRFNFKKYQAEPIVCSFDIKDDKYYFKSTLKATDAELLLGYPNQLFQLQRRNDFRVNIPSNVTYLCELKTIDGRSLNIMTELRDLSLGGCLVSIKDAADLNVEQDSKVVIHIKVNEFDNANILTTAKHIKVIKESRILQLGLKYIDPSAELLSELQTLLMQLDRIHRRKDDD